MNKYEALEKKEAFKEKVRARLTAPDVRLYDFCNIDNEDWLITPSINETTLKIWHELKNMCVEEERTSAHIDVEEVINELRGEIVEIMGVRPLNEDDRLPSEIADEEFVSVTAAKIYKHLINIKMAWFLACDYDETQYDLPYVDSLLREFQTGVNYYLIDKAIINSAKGLATKNIYRMKVADILGEKS